MIVDFAAPPPCDAGTVAKPQVPPTLHCWPRRRPTHGGQDRLLGPVRARHVTAVIGRQFCRPSMPGLRDSKRANRRLEARPNLIEDFRAARK